MTVSPTARSLLPLLSLTAAAKPGMYLRNARQVGLHISCSCNLFRETRLSVCANS